MLKKILATSPLTTPIIVSLLFLLTGFVLYGSAGHDDSHITFWASYTLSEFGQIVNYNGDRIEQSSSLLLTVCTALFAFIFHSDVVTTGYTITVLSGAVAIAVTWHLAQYIAPSHNFATPLIATILLATSPAFLLWNTSGMESTLAALCLLWFILQWAGLLSGKTSINGKSLTIASIATLCLISVRPEMIAIAAGLAFILFIYRRISRLRGSVPILVFYSTILLMICILAAFRYLYFGSPMPLPVSSKVSSLSTEKLWYGFYYLLRYGFANIVFIIALPVALLALFRQSKTEKPNFYLLLSAFSLLAYSGFILLSGGDWMQMGRFLVPILPLAAIISALHFQHSVKNTLYSGLLIVAVIGLNIHGNWMTLKQESHGTPVWAGYHISPEHQQRYSIFEQYNQEHLRDMDAIDTLDNTINALLKTGHHPVTLMSGQSGMVFFYTAKKYLSPSSKQKVHFTDTRALIEDSLLRCYLVDDIERSSQGLYFDFDKFFAKQPGLLDECKIPEPDILYDINDMTRQLPERMKEQGYSLIHKEGGKMVETKSALPTNTLPAANFVMVADDLLKDLHHPDLTVIRYHEKPLVDRW